jgi:uncharacterized membrane protein YgdD (TMEM256/DUF423 family)
MASDRLFLALAAGFGALGVALGAFGAHALRDRLGADMLAIFETGVRYQVYHAFALVAVFAALMKWPGSGLLAASGWLFVAGIIIFSGSLYILALSGVRTWGAVTPLGGVAFLAGWICLLVAAVRG